MITGDNPLTACHVAHEVGIADKSKEFLTLVSARSAGDGAAAAIVEDGGISRDHGDSMAYGRWVDASSATVAPFDINGMALRTLSDRYEMCITGQVLVDVSERGLLRCLLPFVTVYARTTPDQKAVVVSAFNDAGFQTLMCGDGTNDVAALRRAHVGIALTPGHVMTKAAKRGAKLKRGRSEQPTLDIAAQEYVASCLVSCHIVNSADCDSGDIN